MNLAAYDSITNNKSVTKVCTYSTYPYIITREVRYRKYYCYVKRYEPNLGNNVLYLVLLDDKPIDRQVCKTRLDNYGRLKFNLSSVKNIFNLNIKQYNIKLSIETQADDGDIYKIELESD